jgi:hypothetical protein
MAQRSGLHRVEICDVGLRLPYADANAERPVAMLLRFCGAEIDIAGTGQHVYTAHMILPEPALTTVSGLTIARALRTAGASL